MCHKSLHEGHLSDIHLLFVNIISSIIAMIASFFFLFNVTHVLYFSAVHNIFYIDPQEKMSMGVISREEPYFPIQLSRNLSLKNPGMFIPQWDCPPSCWMMTFGWDTSNCGKMYSFRSSREVSTVIVFSNNWKKDQ